MQTAVISFPGINREKEAIDILTDVTGKKPIIIWYNDTDIPTNIDLIMLPGGFSYGDYLRAGAMASVAPIIAPLRQMALRGVPVLGICNGFQILCEAGLLHGALSRNIGLKFICKYVHLRIENNQSPFTCDFQAGDVIKVPVAHMDGRYIADTDMLKKLHDNNQILFKYCDEYGTVSDAGNPNGSDENIAGILNEKSSVGGWMPHPENAVFPYQHSLQGRKIFTSLLTNFLNKCH